MKSERELKIEWLSRSKPLRLRLIGLRAEHMERLSRSRCIEAKYLALIETEAELLAVIQELDRVEAEIRAAIEQVRNPVYQTYLRMRFLAYKPERQIAEEMGYSFSYIDNIVRKKSIDFINIVGNSG